MACLIGLLVAAYLLARLVQPPRVGAQSTTSDSQKAAQPKDTFDVASIKPAGSFTTSPALGPGCDGGFPRVENNRFVVTTTAFALITWAYGFNKHGGCSFVSIGDFLSGGPNWMKSDRFEVQAVMPDGSPTYTTGQFLNGNAPELELMIRNLLADRFKLVVHQGTKTGPLLALVRAKGPLKLSPAQVNGPSGSGAGRNENAPGSRTITLRNTNMTYLALWLVLIVHQPVVDRTGLSGNFDFQLNFAPPDSAADSSAPSIFTALQEQLGLKLEATTGPIDVLVIDHIEEPTPN